MLAAGDQDFPVLAVLSNRHAIGKKRWTLGVTWPAHSDHVAATLRQLRAEMAVG